MDFIVNEIFHSIQGESLHAGRPCVFIRLTGCNLRCTYCDTAYAYHEGQTMGLGDIARRVQSFNCKLVEITGGEPMYQPKTPELIKELINRQMTVLMETNGTLSLKDVDSRCIKIVDIKCPSSGESQKNKVENIHYLNPHDQLKFVIRDKEDYMFSKKFIADQGVPIDMDHVLFSPVSDVLPPHILAQWILDDRLSVRLHLQLHKIIWPDIERGV